MMVYAQCLAPSRPPPTGVLLRDPSLVGREWLVGPFILFLEGLGQAILSVQESFSWNPRAGPCFLI